MGTKMKISKEGGAKLRLISSMLIFGTIGVFVKQVNMPSSVIAMARGIIGTLFLLLLCLLTKQKPSVAAIKKNLPLLIISGVCNGVNWIFLFEAYRYTTVSTATLCYYLAPVFVILLSPLVLHERLTVKKLLCVLGALSGMVLVSGVLNSEAENALQLKGIFFGVGAAMLYSAIILINKHIHDISAYDMTIVQLSTSAVVLLPYVLLSVNPADIKSTPKTVVLLLVLGALHTGVAYALYFSSMKSLKAQTVAIFSYVDPIVAILCSTLLLKENMGVTGAVGAVLVLASTFASEFVDKQTIPVDKEL